MSSFKSVLTGLLLSFIAFDVIAESVSLRETPSLTLSQAIEKTLLQSPEIKASIRTAEVYNARQQQAELGTNPTLTATAEDFLGSGEVSGLDAMQATLSLNFVLDRSLVSSRSQQAYAATSLAAVSTELTRVDAAAETARRFINVLGIEAQLVEQRLALQLSEQSLATVKQAVTAGRRHAGDLYRAKTVVSKAKLAIEDNEHELKVARHLLAARWGSSSPDFHRLEGDPTKLPDPKSWPNILNSLDQSPLKEKFLSEERLAQSTLVLEQSKSRKPLEYQVGIRHLGVSDDVAFVAGVSVPLGWRNQNQGNIKAAEKEFEVIEARQAAITVELRARLFELYQNLQQSLHRSDVLENDIIPNLVEAYELTQVAFEQGRYNYQELQSLQRELLETKRQLIRTNVQAHFQVIEIERLTGTAISKEYAL